MAFFPTFAPGIPELSPQRYAHPPRPRHGHNTPGKRSPDGTLLEYAYTRDLANQFLATIQDKGHNAQLLVPETEDIPLKERVRLANAICTAQGPANVLLISIHINAAGDGTRWHTATGWS